MLLHWHENVDSVFGSFYGNLSFDSFCATKTIRVRRKKLEFSFPMTPSVRLSVNLDVWRKKQEQSFQLFPFDNKFAARWSINTYDYESSGECVRMQNHLNGPTSPCVLAAAPVAMMRPISRFIFPEHDRRPATPPVIKRPQDRTLSTLRNWSERVCACGGALLYRISRRYIPTHPAHSWIMYEANR